LEVSPSTTSKVHFLLNTSDTKKSQCEMSMRMRYVGTGELRVEGRGTVREGDLPSLIFIIIFMDRTNMSMNINSFSL
jgi:hypothetical protein